MSTLNSNGSFPSSEDRFFSVSRKIRFGQTDPAGIVYYPNYFDMFNEIVEDWFEDELGASFRQLHQTDNLGVPVVHVECDFIAPCRLGELYDLTLRVLRVGPTSLHLQIVGAVAGEARIKASLVLVFVNLTTYRAVAPPESLRSLISERIVAGAAQNREEK